MVKNTNSLMIACIGLLVLCSLLIVYIFFNPSASLEHSHEGTIQLGDVETLIAVAFEKQTKELAVADRRRGSLISSGISNVQSGTNEVFETTILAPEEVEESTNIDSEQQAKYRAAAEAYKATLQEPPSGQALPKNIPAT